MSGKLTNNSSSTAWFNSLISDIKELRIQGAEAVAHAGIAGLDRLVAEKGLGAIKAEVEQLRAVRPTEPMLRNAIAYYLAHATEKNHEAVLRQILRAFDGAHERVASLASGLVKDGKTYFTHCHSSTVMGAFKLAKERGVKFCVHNTETRPLFQGRRTAQELAAAGIPILHVVDSSARVALKGCDAVFLGADALLADGTVVNKIGSEMIAELARSRSIKVYVLASSWKFEPSAPRAYKDRLEVRVPAEVWADAPRGVEVRNDAFELVSPRLVTAIITELGIFEPVTAVKGIQRRRSWLFPSEKAR